MTEEEQDSFTSAYNRAKRVLRRINEYATKQASVTDLKMDSPDEMLNTNWQWKMAWYAGYRTAMRNVQDATRT